MFYSHHTPLFIQKLFPKNIWQKKTTKKVIYLTFDDGPTPAVTDWVIDILAKYRARATFFCLGKNIEQHPKIIQRLLQNSHLIANHSYSHYKGWRTHNTRYVTDIEKAQKLIQSIYTKSVSDKLFRPPYGKSGYFQAKALRKKGYKIVLWSVLSGDFDTNLVPEKAIEKILKHTRSGSIVVFHDSKKAFENLQIILPKMLSYWTNKGYTFEILTVD